MRVEHFRQNIPRARKELRHIDQCHSVLSKFQCMKRVMQTVSRVPNIAATDADGKSVTAEYGEAVRNANPDLLCTVISGFQN